MTSLRDAAAAVHERNEKARIDAQLKADYAKRAEEERITRKKWKEEGPRVQALVTKVLGQEYADKIHHPSFKTSQWITEVFFDIDDLHFRVVGNSLFLRNVRVDSWYGGPTTRDCEVYDLGTLGALIKQDQENWDWEMRHSD